MATTPISDARLKALKPKEKPYKVAVGGDGVGGLAVMVFPNGTKVFKLSYHFNGKEKLLTIGKYGLFSLGEARDKAREAKRLIAQGQDPSALKKQEKIKARSDNITFKALADTWLNLRQVEWSEVHYEDIVGKVNRGLLWYFERILRFASARCFSCASLIFSCWI